RDQFSVLRVVGYLTFRTAIASLTALLLSLVLGPWLIRRLREFQIGQAVRSDVPATHKPKAGTPTMGGLLILAAVLVPTLLGARRDNARRRVGGVAPRGVGGDWIRRRLPEGDPPHAPRLVRPLQVCRADRRGAPCGRDAARAGGSESAAVRHASDFSVLQKPH